MYYSSIVNLRLTLDLMILEVFSNINDSAILLPVAKKALWELDPLWSSASISASSGSAKGAVGCRAVALA